MSGNLERSGIRRGEAMPRPYTSNFARVARRNGARASSQRGICCQHMRLSKARTNEVSGCSLVAF